MKKKECVCKRRHLFNILWSVWCWCCCCFFHYALLILFFPFYCYLFIFFIPMLKQRVCIQIVKKNNIIINIINITKSHTPTIAPAHPRKEKTACYNLKLERCISNNIVKLCIMMINITKNKYTHGNMCK